MNKKRMLPFFLFLTITFVSGTTLAKSNKIQTDHISLNRTRPRDDSYQKTPAQVNVSIADSPSEMFVTFTTINGAMTRGFVELKEVGSNNVTFFAATQTQRSVKNSHYYDESGSRITHKVFYEATLSNLKPNTNYEYTCHTEDKYGLYSHVSQSFWTPMAENDDDSFSFIYITDPQINIGDGKAASTTTEFAKTLVPDAKFMYIAGDLINGSWPEYDESQWEGFFNQPYSNYYNSNFTNMMSDFTIAAVQGNHDNENFNHHVRHPSTFFNTGGDDLYEHKLTYAFSWGMLRMIMINTEWRSKEDYALQKEFITNEVQKAQAKGQYTAVCFHRPLYTGADHISSSDTIERRKEFSALFASLNIDMVLQGHDHVVSRGQVDGTGYKASQNIKIGERNYYDQKYDNAPLYYVGGTASTFKAYPVVNYNVTSGDPVAPNYEFLDINSAQPIGHPSNPLGPSSYLGDVFPSFTKVVISNEYVRFDTYMYGYDAQNDEIVQNPFLYDSYTMLTNSGTIASDHQAIKTNVINDITSKINVSPIALPGEKVLVSVDVGPNLAVDSLIVTTGSINIPLEKSKFGYTFVMPNEEVNVTLTVTKDPRLPLEQDSLTISSYGDEYYFKTTNEPSLPLDAFSALTDGWESGLTPIGYGTHPNFEVSTPFESGGKPLTYIKKTFTLEDNFNFDNILGLTGEHRVTDGLILYLNDEEVYRFNTGSFGEVAIGKTLNNDAFNKGTSSLAKSRQFAVTSNANNQLNKSEEESGNFIFEAHSVTNVRGALKTGLNVLTALVLQDVDENDSLLFDLDLRLLSYSSATLGMWESAITKLEALLPQDAALYDPVDYAKIINYINGAIALIESQNELTPQGVQDIIENTILMMENNLSLPEQVIREITKLPASVDKSHSVHILHARLMYDALTAVQQAEVTNYSWLESREALLGVLPDKMIISTLPSKQTYYLNETIDLSGLVAEVILFSGQKTIINFEDIEVLGFDSTKPGTKVLVLKHNDLVATFTIEVLAGIKPPQSRNYTGLVIGSGLGLLVIGCSLFALAVSVKHKKRIK